MNTSWVLNSTLLLQIFRKVLHYKFLVFVNVKRSTLKSRIWLLESRFKLVLRNFRTLKSYSNVSLFSMAIRNRKDGNFCIYFNFCRLLEREFLKKLKKKNVLIIWFEILRLKFSSSTLACLSNCVPNDLGFPLIINCFRLDFRTRKLCFGQTFKEYNFTTFSPSWHFLASPPHPTPLLPFLLRLNNFSFISINGFFVRWYALYGGNVI